MVNEQRVEATPLFVDFIYVLAPPLLVLSPTRPVCQALEEPLDLFYKSKLSSKLG